MTALAAELDGLDVVVAAQLPLVGPHRSFRRSTHSSAASRRSCPYARIQRFVDVCMQESLTTALAIAREQNAPLTTAQPR